jgi:FkbM family methyltransferase
VKYEFAVDSGETVEFECAPDVVSRWMHTDILRGRTYPFLPFVDDVRIVFDVGANCGSVSVHLARHYPDAVIHAFEPGSEQREFLLRNVGAYANVQVHPIGLHATDQEVPLYFGADNSGLASVTRRADNVEASETVQLRAAGPWATEHGVARIDILKVDVEGCELDVLTSLEHLLPTVKVLYVEYDSRHDRRRLEALLRSTHELYRGLVFLDQGECIYVRRDYADHPDARPFLMQLFVGDTATGAEPPERPR